MLSQHEFIAWVAVREVRQTHGIGDDLRASSENRDIGRQCVHEPCRQVLGKGSLPAAFLISQRLIAASEYFAEFAEGEAHLGIVAARLLPEATPVEDAHFIASHPRHRSSMSRQRKRLGC